MKRFVIALTAFTALAACGSEPAPEPETVAAPNIGPADSASGDVADRDCMVVLREVHRLEDKIGDSDEFGNVEIEEATNCVDRRCWRIFEGTFDVDAEIAKDAEAGVIYRSREGDFFVAEAQSVPGGVEGFERFEFRLDENTIVTGVPSMTEARAHLEVIPFVKVSNTRIFDHNVFEGDEENYELTQRGEWKYEQRADVCPAKSEGAVVRFFDDFTHEQDGALVPGGALTIEYALDRLPQCQGTFHNGNLAWQVGVSMVFPPSDQIIRRQLMVAENAEAVPTPATVFVPTDAEAVEMWFHTSGAECETHFDSNMDENYRFEVTR